MPSYPSTSSGSRRRSSWRASSTSAGLLREGYAIAALDHAQQAPDRPVDGRRDTVDLAEPRNLAAERVDLGAPMGKDVCGHRGDVGTCPGEGLAAMLPGRVAIQGNPRRVGDGDGLVEHLLDHRKRMLVERRVAYRAARQRADRAHRPGERELGPDHDIGGIEG